jgi:prophage tail gpP-like protein
MAFFDAKAERQSYDGSSVQKDTTTAVTLVIGGQQIQTKDYCYISDVLGLGDPFSCTVPNPDGQYSSLISKGATVKVYMADPAVRGGSDTLMFTGVVVSRDFMSDSQGSRMRVTCADLGWHLQNNTAPVWLNLRGLKWEVLLTRLIDSSWGFAGTSVGLRLNNPRLKLGRAGAQLQIGSESNAYPAVLPRIQVEPGETCADVLIKYARLSKLLVNVTGDGYLMVYTPNYATKNFYAFEYHKSTEKDRDKNNLQSVTINDSIQGVYTDVSCYSVVLVQNYAVTNNVNQGHYHGDYHHPADLPFVHRLSFADAEQMSRPQAVNRAEWKAKRGKFDSWKYEVVVTGHQQGGSYFIPNVMCSVNDTVHGVKGNYYVQSVKMERSSSGGTQTTLTLREPNLLAA